MGRATQGVTLINLDEGTKLSGLQRIAETDADNGAGSEGAEDADADVVEGAAGTAGVEGADGATDADANS